MIVGNNYSELQKCDYLDFNSRSSADMLLKCIGDKNIGKDGLCTSDYTRLYDNISRNSENIMIKRGMDAGYGLLPNQKREPNRKREPNKDREPNKKIEGFITGDGLGESFVEPNTCPDGYRWCSKSLKCVQVCTNCKYNDGMKSKEFNEADKCFPNGVYDGISNDGKIKCTCGNNNQYCADNSYSVVFTTDGSYLENNNIKNIGNTTDNIRTYFDFTNL